MTRSIDRKRMTKFEALRLHLGLRQEDVAKHTRITQCALSKYEHHKKPLSRLQIFNIIDFFKDAYNFVFTVTDFFNDQYVTIEFLENLKNIKKRPIK